MTITEIISKLQNYDGPDTLTLHPGADEALLQRVESAYNIMLPDDFKEFYRFTNGFEMDEDIFNMIPLEEVIDSKKRHKEDPLYIAEYMIYCDMWELEINPENHNDYKIINSNDHNNKLLLTNSLAGFIERFLWGGVFGDGGLYEWHEELQSQSIYPTSPRAHGIKGLLTAFYYGLTYGIISGRAIVDWADEIIESEDEPNHFFIEISLSHDTNELISILNKMSAPESAESIRVILGLLYHQLLHGKITADKAISVIDKCNTGDLLTKFECADIYKLTDEIWWPKITTADDELISIALKFLTYYQEFNLTNYKSWIFFNYHLENKFKSA